MSFDIKTFRNDIIGFLESHNSTTTGLSKGLNTPVQKIVGGTPSYGQYNTVFPVVWVALGSYSEEINTIGNSAHRDANFTVEIYPATQFGIGVYDNGGPMKEAEDEMITLVQNIQDKIRDDVDLGISGLQVKGIDVEFNQDFPGETNYVKAARISLNCYKFIS